MITLSFMRSLAWKTLLLMELAPQIVLRAHLTLTLRASYSRYENSHLVLDFKFGDGYFSAKRYNSIAVEKINEPLFQSAFILSSPDSSDVLTITCNDSCSTFRSGDNQRKANHHCDISGLFGSVCPSLEILW